MDLSFYINLSYKELPILRDYDYPWDVTQNMHTIIGKLLSKLSAKEYKIENNIAIHKTAVIEDNVVLKEYSIIGKNSLVKSGAYLRDGVYIGNNVIVGTNCEIKQSIIFPKSRVAHLNYVGNSIIGEDVNLEAGSVLANHFNEFDNENIKVLLDESIIDTSVLKFGSLIGDGSRIGANSVLNPGTILKKETIIGRLVHVDQLSL